MAITGVTEVNEGTTAYFTATFKDKNGNNSAPTSARYYLYCTTTSTVVVDWTNIPSPSSVQEVEVDAGVNVMTNESNLEEKRVLVIEGTYGASDKVTERYPYTLTNMYGI